MKSNVISISETATIREVAAMIVKKHIGLLPVVDKDNKLVGVVGLRDPLTLESARFAGDACNLFHCQYLVCDPVFYILDLHFVPWDMNVNMKVYS